MLPSEESQPRTGVSRERVAASPKEEALWLLETLVPGCAANNLPLALQVGGKLQRPALRRALSTVVHRYPVLRTVYHIHDAQLTKASLGSDGFRLDIERLHSSHPSAEEDLAAFVARPFGLNGQPLLRAGLLSRADGDFFCLVFHHLIFDVISATIFMEEFVAAYEGKAPDSAAVRPVDPLVDAEPRPESVSFWQEQLADFDPDGSDLWCGASEVSRPTLLGDHITRRLSPAVTKSVHTAQKELRSPEAVILLAAYCLLLDGHGAGPDVVVGTPVNVRSRGAERAIGYHVNFLPLAVRVDRTMSVRDLVRRTRDVFFNSLVNSDVPVDSLTRALPRSAFARRAMLFRHVFNYLPSFALPEFILAGCPARTILVENGYSKFDIEFFVMSSAEDIQVRIAYRPEIFSRSDVELMLERYEALLLTLTAATDRPVSEILVWGERDRAVIEAANRTAAHISPASVLEGFYGHVTTAPDQIAIEDGKRKVTYRGLWEAACAVSGLLKDHRVVSGDVVAVAAKRGAELAAAVLGIWLAGATYLPIDPDHPAQRIRYQLSDSNTRVIVADEEPMARLGDEFTVLQPKSVFDESRSRRLDELPHSSDPAACAYLIYTSGSTGRPKGTLISHLALVNATAHFVEELDVGPDDAMLWMTTFAFDISGLELFVPLWSGGRVVVAPDEARVDGRVLRDLIKRHEVAVIQATPTTWRIVLGDSAGILRGRKVLCGGEILPVTTTEQLVATGCELHHVYGPTESTIWSTSGTVSGPLGSRLDVGRPIRNTQVMIMDPEGRELPIGVTGELCVAGHGVAEGYHNLASLTAERFREHPRHGRYYRTGDTARWRLDGTLELLGRNDRQIKLRGNRIELGEIEAALLRHPEVKAAAVIVFGDPGADAKLIAFVEASRESLSIDALWERVRSGLSRAMVPQEFVVIDALPTNANEKVDYPALAALAAEAAERAAETGTRQETRTHDDDEFLTVLVALWVELLEHRDVTADTNFFTSGGDSLRGALLGQRIEDHTGVSIPLAELFENPTPRSLAAWIRTSGAGGRATP
jgi:amino acid adenylation domain-containing protein